MPGSTYDVIPASKIPPGVRFDVPLRHQGEVLEIAYGGFSMHPHENGDLYKRLTDYSRPIDCPRRVHYFKRNDRETARLALTTPPARVGGGT